ncbi:MAG: hypothetical protein KDK12_00180 [Rhodobacteraceae bacterium]|nr:hypothetical protein [Paracoccaceae bacterium]
MSTVTLMIQLHVEESDLPSFDGADLMIVPHITAEREGMLMSLARIEQCVEASGDTEAVRAFQWLGGLLTRATYTAGAKLRQGPGRRFDA